MNYLWYKIYLEIQLKEGTPLDGAIATGFMLEPTKDTLGVIADFRLKYKCSPGKIEVYYPGYQDMGVLPGAAQNLSMKPIVEIPDKTEFIFWVRCVDSSTARFTENRLAPGDDASVTDIVVPFTEIRPGVFTHSIAGGGGSPEFKTLEVRDETNTRTLRKFTVKKDDNNNYKFGMDISSLKSGIYSFTDGGPPVKYFVDIGGEAKGAFGYIRVKKNGAWLSPVKVRVDPADPALPDHNLIQYYMEESTDLL